MTMGKITLDKRTLFKRTLFVLIISSSFLMFDAHALEFSVFGDTSVGDGSADGEELSFGIGALDFFVTAPIDDKTRVFVEYVFENGGDGLVTDLERLWISRYISEGFTIAAGRFHSPLGHWNRTYHHGSFMQDTVSRPFFLDFEDGAAGVLPVHVVGLMGWGEREVGGGAISFEVALSNGSSINTDEFGLTATASGKPEIEINDASDPNGDKSLGIRLRYSSNSIPFKIGGFLNVQEVAESGAGTMSMVMTGEELLSQTVAGIDFQYRMDAFDLALEFYNFDHESDLSTGENTSGTAYYLQLGWKVDENLKLLFRHEDLSFDDNDVWFNLLGAGEGTRTLLASRYDLSSTNTLKFEINLASPDIGDDETTWTLQWAFMIP